MIGLKIDINGIFVDVLILQSQTYVINPQKWRHTIWKAIISSMQLSLVL